MRRPLKCIEAGDLSTRASRRDAKAPEEEIAGGQCRKRSDNCDRPDPPQYDLVEVIPGAAGGLNEDPRLRIELVDVPLDAGKFLQQRPLIDRIRLRLECRARLLGEGRHREADKPADRNPASRTLKLAIVAENSCEYDGAGH